MKIMTVIEQKMLQTNARVNLLSSRSKLKKQQGVSELLGYGLAALLVLSVLAVAFYAYQRNSIRNQISSLSNEVVDIAGSARERYGLANKFSALTTAVAVQGGVIPQNRQVPGTTNAENSFGGAITMTPVNLTGTADGVALAYAAVPSSVCTDAVQRTKSAARRISVGGVVIKPLDGDLNETTLATNCAAGATVAIVWDIGRNTSGS